jgi:hypothetical protein
MKILQVWTITSCLRYTLFSVVESKESDSSDPWPDHFNAKLKPFLSHGSITQLKEMFLQGPEPPRASDSGWPGVARAAAPEEPSDTTSGQGKEKHKKGKHDRRQKRPEDPRKVLSEVSSPSVFDL